VQTNCKAHQTRPKKTGDGLKIQKDVRNRGNELNNSFGVNESVRKRTQNEPKTNWFFACKRTRKTAFWCQVPGFRFQGARAIVQANCKAHHTRPKKTGDGLKIQKDVKNRGNKLNNSLGINESAKNNLKTNSKRTGFLHANEHEKWLLCVKYRVSDVPGSASYRLLAKFQGGSFAAALQSASATKILKAAVRAVREPPPGEVHGIWRTKRECL